MKRIGIYSGSFDPITNGHLWVVEEGQKLFDEFHVLIGPVAKRDSLFTPHERKNMIDKVVKPPTIVDIIHTNILRYMQKLDGEIFLLRGIRNDDDFNYEMGIVHCIRATGGNFHYLFVTPPKELFYVSSSYAKELCASGDWNEVSKIVPPHVVDDLKTAYKNKKQTYITTDQVTSIFETTTAGFAPDPSETFCMWDKAERDINVFSSSGHHIPMVDELEEVLGKLGNSKVNLQFFGKMKDNFKQLEDNGFIKFSDFVTSEQVRFMLDPCHIDVVSSETYELKEIPIHSVTPMGDRYLPCSQSLGPIIVDLKPEFYFPELGPVVVIEGKHRWLDAKERGDKTILAYVGNKAMKYFKESNAS